MELGKGVGSDELINLRKGEKEGSEVKSSGGAWRVGLEVFGVDGCNRWRRRAKRDRNVIGGSRDSSSSSGSSSRRCRMRQDTLESTRHRDNWIQIIAPHLRRQVILNSCLLSLSGE